MAINGSGKPESLPSDRASSLTELVEVAEGSIVSRVLAKSTGCNVTLFAFDRGQGLSEHTAPFDALVQVVDGALDLRIGEASVTVERVLDRRCSEQEVHLVHAHAEAQFVEVLLLDGVALLDILLVNQVAAGQGSQNQGSQGQGERRQEALVHAVPSKKAMKLGQGRE